MSILIFVVILLVLVLVHEFGHFFTAKKFGIRVDEFGFGFPPKLFGKKYGETEYSINLLPIGGFVKIFGENPNDENTNGPDRERSFVHKPRWQQAIVLFAGVLMNFLLAWFLFSIGFMSGLPASVGSVSDSNLHDVNLVILSIAPGSPAEKAGLKSGDKILHVKNAQDSITNLTPDTVKSFITSTKNKEIEIGYVRGNEIEKFVKVTPEVVSGESKIGISMDHIGIAKLPFFSALKEGAALTLSMAKGTFLGLYGLITDGIRGRGSFES